MENMRFLGLKDFKMDLRMIQSAKEQLWNAEPHLNKLGIYDYDKVPRECLDMVEHLLSNYEGVCKVMINTYREMRGKKA